MPFPEFERSKLRFQPLKERRNRVFIEKDHVSPSATPCLLGPETQAAIREAGRAVREARSRNRPVVLAFGAHTIKNGLSPVLIELIQGGWLTHLSTNGAGIIHDWEFAYLGASSEDVRENVRLGRFGIWEETGRYLNLALLIGAYEGLGYGESIGSFVQNDGLEIPAKTELIWTAEQAALDPERAAAAADLLWAVENFDLQPGFLRVQHPFKKYGLQAAAFRLKVPFTAHPMFGHDIIYTHPLNRGAAVGRTAERDFLVFTRAIDFSIFVVDLAESSWDWQKDGEPPPDNPAYYVRYLKTFSRMGGSLSYVRADNRDFLLTLVRELGTEATAG
jgi:hypothetical protein